MRSCPTRSYTFISPSGECVKTPENFYFKSILQIDSCCSCYITREPSLVLSDDLGVGEGKEAPKRDISIIMALL